MEGTVLKMIFGDDFQEEGMGVTFIAPESPP
jgi:hypothetical protein